MPCFLIGDIILEITQNRKMFKILFLLMFPYLSHSQETSWGTFYNPTSIELSDNYGSINLQEYHFLNLYHDKNYYEASLMAVYPIQRAYSLMKMENKSDKKSLKRIYLTLAQGDGSDHYTEGEEILHTILDKLWIKTNE